MKTLVVGASGATGKLVVSQLVANGLSVKIIIRNTAIIPKELSESKNVEIIKGNINDFTVNQISEIIKDCNAIVSCLGHNISFKGIFGKPQKLVYNAMKNITHSINLSDNNYKFILMSTTAYTNRIVGEKNTFAEKVIFGLLKLLLPPHADNVASGDFLLYKSLKSKNLEWVAVRPDSLIDEEKISEYNIVEKKTRSPIFNPGKTSRINVAHFIVNLLLNDTLWQNWKYNTPVLYNKE